MIFKGESARDLVAVPLLVALVYPASAIMRSPLKSSSAKRLLLANYPKQLFRTLFLALIVLSQVQTGELKVCRHHILGSFSFSFSPPYMCFKKVST